MKYHVENDWCGVRGECAKSSITYLSVVRLERIFDLLSLGVGPLGQHVDDGLLVGSESFHGRPERGRVRVRVEVGRRADCGCALRTTNITRFRPAARATNDADTC